MYKSIHRVSIVLVNVPVEKAKLENVQSEPLFA